MTFARIFKAALPMLLGYAPLTAEGQSIAGSYATSDGRASTVVIACPNPDGSFTAGPCTLARPPSVIFTAPASATIVAANVPVTVFPAGSIATGCDIINTGTMVLYIDLTTKAMAGSATSIPLQPGQAFHCPYPPAGAVTAVAAQQQPFVAVSY